MVRFWQFCIPTGGRADASAGIVGRRRARGSPVRRPREHDGASHPMRDAMQGRRALARWRVCAVGISMYAVSAVAVMLAVATAQQLPQQQQQQQQQQQLSAVHLEPRAGRAHGFVNEEGQELIFHGTSAIVKGPPWYPDHSSFSTDISMAREDFEWMQKLGLNFLRLGVMWPGTEPVRGQYNESYLDQISAVVELAAEHGVYTMLDMHQDGLSEFMCGEGLPYWAVKVDHAQPFPEPFSRFENESCFYREPRQQYARFPTKQACDSHSHGPSFGESTFASAQGYQALWSNYNGTGDAFAAMWGKVAERFKGRPEVLGYNLVNEPFAGDFYRDPLIMVPYPSSTNADRVNLQPVYDKVNAVVRKVDENVLLFIAGVTWGDLGSGFSAAPGGAAYSNRTVMTYHYYQPPNFGAFEQVSSHVREAQRLGTGALMSETEAIWSPGKYDKNGNITDACDAHLQGWVDWGWKSFTRAGDNIAPQSQYGVWGSGKTGHGCDWNGPNEPPGYYMQDLARTYAPRVAGSVSKMAFNASTSEFQLEYVVGGVSERHVTEIFLWPGRYGAAGAHVVASATVGTVRLDYTRNGSSWVRVYAGTGLRVGARVMVSITKPLRL